MYRTTVSSRSFSVVCRRLLSLVIAAIAFFGLGSLNVTYADGYPADLDWRGVAFGNGVFVAVASSGTGTRVMTSSDGLTWTPRQSATDSDWNAVTFHNNLFVAVGTDAVMTSTDGISWTAVTAPLGYWDSVVGCNGTYVATSTIGASYVMYSTSPSSSWTVTPPAHGWDHQQLACNPDGTRFVSSSHYGRVWTSPDGITWATGSTPIVHIHANAFAELNGIDTFVWLEYNDYDNNGSMSATSTNGTSFTAGAYNSNLVNGWNYLMYGSGKFIAVADSGSNVRAAYSTDGINWSLGSGIPANTWEAVAYGNGRYVAVASSGTGDRVATSTDGIIWTALSVDSTLNNSPTENPASGETTVPDSTTTTVTESNVLLNSQSSGTTKNKANSGALPQTGFDFGASWFALTIGISGGMVLLIRRRLAHASE